MSVAPPAPRPLGRLLKISDGVRETSLGRSTIYERIARDQFPRPHQLSPRRVAWSERDIEAWKANVAATPPDPPA